MASRILIVEDELLLAKSLAVFLKNLGYEVTGKVSSAEEALRIVEESKPDLILMDIKLEGEMDGIEAADLIRSRFELPVVYMTGYAEEDVLERAKLTEPYGYLGKPVTMLELRSTIETALYKHQMDKRLRQSEEKLKSTLRSMDDLVFVLDKEGVFLDYYQSPEAIDLYVPSEVFLGNHYKDVLPASVAELVHKTVSAVVADDAVQQFDYSLSIAGAERWFNAKISQMKDASGKLAGFTSVVREITDRKKMEEALRQTHDELEHQVEERTAELSRANTELKREIIARKKAVEALQRSEANYRTIFDSAGDAAFVHDLEGTFLDVNRAACERLGYSKEELLTMTPVDIDDPENAREVPDRINAVKERGHLLFETVHLSNRGKSIPSEITARLVDYDGQPAVLSLARDITVRAQSEERFQRQNEFLKSTLEALAHPFYVINSADYTIDIANSTAVVSGISTGSHCYSTTHNTDEPCCGPEHPCPLQEVKKTKQPVMVEHIHYEPDGSVRNVEVHTYPLLDSEGNVKQVIEYCLDITERRKAEEALQQKTLDLGERVKELNCLYGISQLVEKQDMSLDELLQGTVDLIPPSWQYPEVTCARIILDDQEFKSENFGEVVSKQSTDIVVHSEISGSLEVGYLEERPKINEGPFLKEERDLINAIAEQLGRIVEHKNAEEALTTERERLAVTLRSIGDGVISTDTKGRVVSLNEVAEELTGWTEEEAIAKPLEEVFQIVNETTRQRCENPVEKVLQTGGVIGLENDTVLISRDGTERIFADSGAPIKDEAGNMLGVVLVFRDVTDRKKAEDRIKGSLREKEVMLQEIHHRVKNNLAVITSLLALQSDYAPDEANRKMFEDSRARIRSMALAHELLYQSENLADIKVSEYVGNLVDHLVVNTAGLGGLVTVTKEIEDVSFGLDTAIPLGFLMTELVSNCMKHAFPDGSEGEIRIVLRPFGENEFELVVADNGVGMPVDIDLENPTSLGLDLVGTFVEQLKGAIEIRRGEGTAVRIRLKGKQHLEV